MYYTDQRNIVTEEVRSNGYYNPEDNIAMDETKSKPSRRVPDGMSKGLRFGAVVLLFSITVLLIAIAFSLYYGGTNESRYVQASNIQAVEVGTGGSTNSQLYFGNITTLNDKYLTLENVYFIPPSSSGNTLTLEPLVCEIDQPFSQMIISRVNVSWWENLQPSSKIASAITQYQKENPQGASCPSTNNSTNVVVE